MDAAAISDRAALHQLGILGGFTLAADEPGLPRGTRSLVLLGPHEPGFWPHVTAQPEFSDDRPDPLDRWSRRVIGRMACDLRAKALFPFGGPPYRPFYAWMLRAGRGWQSPVRLLVHDRQGLLFSCRGALALKQVLDFTPPLPRPCDSCAAPCLGACPADALTGAGYDLPRCHAYLDRPEGAGCRDAGCAVRRACPVSGSYARLPEQSAWHMRQFHP